MILVYRRLPLTVADRVDGVAEPTTTTTDVTTRECDISTMCLQCGAAMRPEHAHYRCPTCGWRDSCCDGPY
jgi:predicted RNA-binding Zn-ribbon protein involved in translation (DUF1610 family)